MPLPVPILDDRTFDQLVAEARARIPRYTPEWTNFNDPDPGITLVKLHAWLAETILYRLNKLPELTYIKFLELLNVQPHPAVAARAELTFKLKKLNQPSDPLVVLIPKNSQVRVDDPDLEEELIFETDRTLTAINASLAAIITPGSDSNTLELVTEYDAKKVASKILHPSYPFGVEPAVGATCLLGLLLRPHRQKNVDYSLDRFPEGELDLAVFIPEVFETNADNQTIIGPESLECLFPWQATAQAESIIWEAYTGLQPAEDFTEQTAWRRLNVMDETALFSRSGHIYLDVPGGLPAIPFNALHRDFWEELDLKKPPTTAQELLEDIEDNTLAPADLDDEVWANLGLAEPALSQLLTFLGDPVANHQNIIDHLEDNQDTLIHFEAIDSQLWLDAGSYDESPVPYELTWFRARLSVGVEETPQVSRFLLNTVGATAAVTRVEEIIGAGTGRPNQTHRLSKAPILVDGKSGRPELELEIVAQGQAELWQAVPDFFGQTPDSPVFRLDNESGTLIFGDGIHGRIPLAGAEIIARRYRYGGGAVGNAGPDTITALKSALPDVDSVTNTRAATGGADAESLEEVILRAPHDLRMRDRAVTTDDFAELARQTPGVRIQRAYALPLTRVNPATTPPSLVSDAAGAVTVVVLPENKEDTPQPTEEQLRLVCRHLNNRRLITTELYVIGPRYLEIGELKVEVTASRQADLKALHETITSHLLNYFHPLRGGEEGRGWPFGQDIFFGQVYRQLLNLPGVLRVLCLEISLARGSEVCNDIVEVPEGYLIHLLRTAINLKVKYDPYA